MNLSFDYKAIPVIPAGILTNSYVAGLVLGTEATGSSNIQDNDNALGLLVSFTKGSLTNAEIIIEFSPDNSTWYQETVDDVDVSTGNITQYPATHIFTASGNYRINPITLKDRYVRISAKGTGTVTGSSIAVTAILGSI